MWNVLKELVCFVVCGRRWWILPLVALLILLGLLLVLGSGSPLAPFIYTIF